MGLRNLKIICIIGIVFVIGLFMFVKAETPVIVIDILNTTQTRNVYAWSNTTTNTSYVPYEGAVSDVDLGAYDLTATDLSWSNALTCTDGVCTITDGTNIFLNGSANFNMVITDTLTLIQKADGKWYEISRSDNT